MILNRSISPIDRTVKVLRLWVRVDIGVTSMNEYFTCPRALELESHHNMQFSFLPRTHLFWMVTSSYPSAGETVCEF